MSEFMLDSHGAIIEIDSSDSDPFHQFVAFQRQQRQGDTHATLSVPTPPTTQTHEIPTRAEIPEHTVLSSHESPSVASKDPRNPRPRVTLRPARKTIVQGVSVLAFIAIGFIVGLHFRPGDSLATSHNQIPLTSLSMREPLAMSLEKPHAPAYQKIQAPRIHHHSAIARPQQMASNPHAANVPSKTGSLQQSRSKLAVRPLPPRNIRVSAVPIRLSLIPGHQSLMSRPLAHAVLPIKPIFRLLSVRPARLIIGHGATLCVAVKHAQRLVATGLHGVIPNTINCQWITPRRTTTYTFVAVGPHGASVQKSLTVKVYAQMQPAVLRSPRAPLATKKKTHRVHQHHDRSLNPSSALALRGSTP